jgi:hypothetical protein
MHLLHRLPPYGLLGLRLDFGNFLSAVGLKLGIPCSLAPHPAHFAGDGFLLPRLITERPDGVRFFIFFAFLTIRTPILIKTEYLPHYPTDCERYEYVP